MRGAYCESSSRGAAIVSTSLAMMAWRLFRLLHRFAHDCDRDALHLDVHLNRRNALLGAGDFEVHLAQRVF
jgi:hypothetical protein